MQLKLQIFVDAAEPRRWGGVELVLAMLDNLHYYGRQLFSCAVYFSYVAPACMKLLGIAILLYMYALR